MVGFLALGFVGKDGVFATLVLAEIYCRDLGEVAGEPE
jgi:hypothetical protein